MRSKLKAKYILVISFIVIDLLSCNQSSNISPEEITKSYYVASYKYDWSKMARLLDSNSLSNFRNDISKLYSTLDSNFTSWDPLDTINTDTLFHFLRSKNTTHLNNREFFSSFCECVYTFIPRNNPQPDSIITLGFLKEGKDTVHVLTRIIITKMKTNLSGILVLSLSKYQNTWRVLLPDQLENTLKMQLSLRKSRLFE
jgi:hypothetical protein